MVVIFSISKDGTTSKVLEWLKYKGTQEILRINLDKDSVKFVRYDNTDKEFIISKNGKEYNLYNASSFWYRKGGNLIEKNRDYKFSEYNDLNRKLSYKLIKEGNVLNKFIQNFTESTSQIKLGSGTNATLNKLDVLELAQRCNLEVPKTFVISTKECLAIKVKQYGELITKAMSDGIYVYNKNYSYFSYTELINYDSLTDLPNVFFPSLFQVNIQKQYEIRAFLLDREIYSMAIFSQNNSKTKVDFRKYDGEKPNRCIPYILPKQIREKLLMLFDQLNLNTGSADLIVDIHNNFIFLEINPVGQFSMVSYPCNYFLEEKVATYLNI